MNRYTFKYTEVYETYFDVDAEDNDEAQDIASDRISEERIGDHELESTDVEITNVEEDI